MDIQVQTPKISSFYFLPDGGETGKLIRSKNWSATSLGAEEQWPQCLKSSLAILFHSQQPMLLWWGEEALQFYNDAYAELLVPGMHPKSLGQKGSECWGEIWDHIRNESLRNSPIYDPDGRVAGVLRVCNYTDHHSRNVDELLSVLEKIDEGFIKVTKNWSISRVNRQVEKYTGLKYNEALGSSFLDLEFQSEEKNKKYMMAMFERRHVAFEEYHPVFNFWMSISLFPNPDGGMTIFLKDISDEKRAQIIFQDRERLRLALESGLMGTWHIDLKSGLLVGSDQLLKLYGITELPEDYGNAISQIVHPADRDEIKKLLDATISSQSTLEHEYRIIRPDGETRWMFIMAETKFDRFGEPTLFIGLISDITEKKVIEQKLRTEKNKLEALFNLTPASLAFWRGEELVFEKVNAAYQANIGDRELIGKTIIEALPEYESADYHQKMKQVFETGEPIVGPEVLARLPSKETGELEDRYFNYSYIRVDDSEGRPYGVYIYATEITDLISDRLKLEQTVSDLAEEREIREGFVSSLSHDLRTPLAGAKITAQLLGKGLKDPHSLQLIKRLCGSMERMDQMIQDLLDVTKIKAGQNLPLKLESCDLSILIQETLDEMMNIHGERFVFRSPGPVIGYWDIGYLRRMIENLSSNAVKYGSHSRPISVSILKAQEEVNIVVHNEGNPIPEDQQELIFEKFHRTSSATHGPQKGWGIGLALVQGLARAHGGEVSIRSNYVEGTTFTVTIPHDSRNYRLSDRSSLEPAGNFLH